MIQFLRISLICLFSLTVLSEEIKFKTRKDELVSISFSEISGNKSFSQSSGQAITPASVLKIFSMAYALDTLGSDFTFKTKIYYQGKLVGGTLQGDLYLVGDGDPYLNHPQLVNLALAVLKKGIKKVTGSLYYDNSLFPQIDALSKLGLGDQTYNPGVGALNSEFNRLSIWTSSRPPLSIIPGMPLEIKEAKSGFMPTQDFRWNDTKTESWWLRKGAKLSIRTDLPIRNPAMWSANLLNHHLQSFGIEIQNIENKNLPSNVQLISTEESLPLWSLSTLTMEYSNNLLAEAIALRACSKAKVRPLNQQSCADRISKSVNLKKPPKFHNASGLSINNELTASDSTFFLKKNFSKSWKNHTLLSLLSFSGQSGWIRNRLSSPTYNLRVFAKTGSLDFVNNIAGYIRTRTNTWYSFTLFHTEDKKREALSKMNPKNLRSLKNQASSWRKSSLDRTDNFLKEFIDNN